MTRNQKPDFRWTQSTPNGGWRARVTRGGRSLVGSIFYGEGARERAHADARRLREELDGPIPELPVPEPAKKELTGPERILMNEVTRLKRKLAHREGFDTIISARLSELFTERELKIVLPPPVQRPPKKSSVCVGHVHITDTQIGKVTKTYDSNIAYWRLMEMAESTTRYLLVHSDRGIRELHVHFGGDMVEGELIFPHQAHLVDSCVLDQATKHGPTILTAMLVHWLQHFDRVVVHAVSGNHGRPAGKHDGSHPKTSWDRACYRFTKELTEKAMLKLKIPAERLTFNIAEDFYLIDEIVPGYPILLTHGDLIRGGSTGGVPLAGVQRMMRGWADTLPEWKEMRIGHFHQIFSVDVGKRHMKCGGTTESDNAFALAELASQSRPRQTVSIYHPKYGQVAELHVKLEYGYLEKPNKPDMFELEKRAGDAVSG